MDGIEAFAFGRLIEDVDHRAVELRRQAAKSRSGSVQKGGAGRDEGGLVGGGINGHEREAVAPALGAKVRTKGGG